MKPEAEERDQVIDDEIVQKRSISEKTPVQLALVLGFIGVFGAAVWWASGVQSTLDSIKVSISRFNKLDDLENRFQMVEKYGSPVTIQHFVTVEERIARVEKEFELHKAISTK